MSASAMVLEREKKIVKHPEISKFAIKIGMGMAALTGIWGAACILSSLVREIITVISGV